MTDVADKLREARALIAKGWCQGEYGLDASGESTDVLAGDPVRYCALGAIARATDGRLEDASVMLALARAIRSGATVSRAGEIIYKWNDRRCRTQAEVLAAFDKAIALASGTEAGTGETEGLDPKGDGPVPKADAQ